MRLRHCLGFIVVFIALLAGCSTATVETPSVTSTVDTANVTPEPIATPPHCNPPTVIPPTPPANIPGYAKLDETTNLHVTGTLPDIDLAEYRLKVTGKVAQPLSLTYDELRCLPKQEVRALLVCVGFFEDEATWAGASLNDVLDLAQVAPDATALRLRSADGYAGYVRLDAVRGNAHNLLAYEWEGEPLPALHGFPIRAVFPDEEGREWVKWLVEIEVE
ncbi:MAG TPA: molybdopterin-dependent oxidoreductase [Anaerolineae bacterium]|nr:molybdopterin-dependent oxidoreductase [Anaerolineae bacterium]